MATLEAEVWVLHAHEEVVVQDFPGIPASVMAEYVGTYPLAPDGGWGEAKEIAIAKAQGLGYRVEYMCLDGMDDT